MARTPVKNVVDGPAPGRQVVERRLGTEDAPGTASPAALVTLDVDHPVWSAVAAGTDAALDARAIRGGIVRLCPPPTSAPEDAAMVERACVAVGALAVKHVPPRRASVVPEKVAARAVGSHREVVLMILAGVRSADNAALMTSVVGIADEEGL